MAYGCIPGHKTSCADAVRAYVQALLKSVHKTWVHIPRDLWPPEWRGKYEKPMCLLEKALYGHPESGGHWERHLTEAVCACGGEALHEHPSSFWFPKWKLILSVYVDDLLVSGPAANHDKLWHALQSGEKPIVLDPPEDLSRYLGRNHTVW